MRLALQGADMTGRRLVLAVSGGPDSMALLYTICSLRKELDLTLHGAHLDHGLRGKASREDARIVGECFSRLGIDATLESADVAGYQKSRRLSVEEAAREVRYTFLARVAEHQNAAAVVLGHTADDQAESVLMHLLRGSGLTGLRGMQPVTSRTEGGRQIVLVRPLLELSRAETEACCEAMGLEPRRDETNDLTAFTRNRVRLELLPLLESYNPSIKQGLVRLARNASLDSDYIQRQVDSIWDQVCTADVDGVTINLTAFHALHPALQMYLLRGAVLRVKGDLRDLELVHVEDMVRLSLGPAGKAIDLPGGVRFAVSYGEAAITSIKRANPGSTPPKPIAGCHEVRLSGVSALPGWEVRADLTPAGDPTRTSDLVSVLSRRALGDKLWVRSRNPGDRFQPLGMAHQKKLQDFMVDCKIPRDRRDHIPLLVTPRGIAWVVGWRIAEWAKAGDEEGDQIVMEFAPSG